MVMPELISIRHSIRNLDQNWNFFFVIFMQTKVRRVANQINIAEAKVDI
jgi:hypothetical protein